MNESDKTFRDKLLDTEKPNVSYKEKYERQVQEMVEKKLTGVTKWSHIGGLIMGLGFAVLFGTVAVVSKEALWLRLFFAMGAIFGLVIIAAEGSILKKGTINLKEDPLAMAWMGWGFVVIIAAVIMVFSRKVGDPTKVVRAFVFILFFLVVAAVGLLKAIIERSELNNREKLLEIEYRLAELAEKLEGEPEKLKEKN